MHKIIKTIEKKIIGKMNQIKRGEITPKESEIGKLFNTLKELDEALYESLLSTYKNIIKNL